MGGAMGGSLTPRRRKHAISVFCMILVLYLGSRRDCLSSIKQAYRCPNHFLGKVVSTEIEESQEKSGAQVLSLHASSKFCRRCSRW